MLTERQNLLLKTIIQQYIKTAEPVSSELLADKYRLSAQGRSASGGKISSATIRNEMTELTTNGFLAQPHTSAGRIPTEKAYHYYIENFLQQEEVSQIEKRKLNSVKKENQSLEISAKKIGEKIAELTNGLVILAFDKNNFYYTGLSSLFSQPEFNQMDVVYNVSQIIDHLDQTVAKIFDEIESNHRVFLGQSNPFGDFCGTILIKYHTPNQKRGVVLGLLGPMRMDYNRNIALIEYAKEILDKV